MTMSRISIIKNLCALVLATAMVGCAAAGLLPESHPAPAGQFVSITEDGAWCWFSDPRAVYYEGDHRRTYAGWVNSRGGIEVGYYDHDAERVETKTILRDFQADDHNHPSLMITPRGRLQLFFSKHATDEPILMSRSKAPESIDAWEPPDTLRLNNSLRYRQYSDTYTYSHPVYLADERKLYLFWRGSDFKPNMATSGDMGESWSNGRIFILPERTYRDRRPYLKVDSNGRDRIFIAFTQGHPRREPDNSVYYMSYHDGRYYRADGSVIRKASGKEPVTPGEADLVYDASQGARAWVWDVAHDEDGNPVVAYVKFPDDSSHVYCYARWVDGEWKNYELVDSGKWFPETPRGEDEPEPNYSGGLSLDHENPDIVYLSRERDGVFEVERWVTADKGETWDKNSITGHSDNDNVRPVTVRNAEAGNPLQLLWMNNQKYIHYTQFNSAIKMPLLK